MEKALVFFAAPLPQRKKVRLCQKKRKVHTLVTRKPEKKANEKYLKESVEDIRIRVPKGDKAKVQEHAASMGESTNAFVIRAINETMERDTKGKS